MNEKLPIMSKLGIIFLTWRRYLQRDLNPYKMTLKQLYILRQLTKKDFLYPSQLAEMLFCDRPTVTVIINNLEREKWIIREKDPENAKQIRILITDFGREKLHVVDNTKSSNAEKEFDPLACLSEDEKYQFNLLLNKIGKYIEKIEK